MQYADLTTDQKAQVQAFMDVYRPILGQVARIFAQTAGMENAWNGSISALVTSLDAGAIVAAPTGLAGAAPLTRESVITTMGNFAAALASFNTDTMRQGYINAAGLSNTL